VDRVGVCEMRRAAPGQQAWVAGARADEAYLAPAASAVGSLPERSNVPAPGGTDNGQVSLQRVGLERQIMANSVAETEAVQGAGSDDNGVEVACVELGKPFFYGSAQRRKLEVGAKFLHL